MEPINLAGSSPSSIVPCVQPAVYVDGVRRDDLVALEWEVLPSPKLGQCLIGAGRPPGADACPGVESLQCLPPIGARVELQTGDGASGQLLAVTVAQRLEVGPAGPVWVAQARSLLADRLSAQILGRYQRCDEGASFLDNGHVHFNGAAGLLASAQTMDIAGRRCRVFDGAADARQWTVADALAYLLAAHVPADVTTPTLDQLSELGADVDLNDFDATGLELIEALTQLAHRGGLDVRAGRAGLELVFYRPGLDGRRKAVLLQPPGQVFSADATNLQAASASLSAATTPTVLALGDYKQYEATFDLKPGWDGALQTSRWRDFVRSLSGDWPALANVYRRWVLNEHGWYNDAPWNLPQCDLSSVSEDFQLVIPRTFQPCVSGDAAGQSMGVFVEVRCGDAGSWRVWPGPVWVSSSECAVYLGGDALPADFFQAAVAGKAAVRVTAALRSDVRIEARAAGEASGGVKVVDFARRAKWSAVHSSSVFATGAGSSCACDDTPQLQRWAQLWAQRLRARAQGHLTLGWIDASFHAGDLIAGIDGQGLDWSMGSARPHVRSVKHDFQKQHTILGIGG